MKKSLFGYNKKETDNLYNTMQNHIDVLTGKITNLNAELASKNNKPDKNEEFELKITELKEKLSQLEKENNALKHELKITKAKAEAPAEKEKKVEHIGKIYLTAYEDAEKIKKNAIEDAEEYMRKFENVKKDMKQRLGANLEDICSQQANMESYLNDTVQNIVEMLRDFGIQSDIMMNKIDELDKS